MPILCSGPSWCLLALTVALVAASCRLSEERHRHCTESTESGYCMPERVSLERLIGTPAAFHGRRVRVRGFAHVAVDNSGIYPTKEDSDEWRSKRGLWLDVPTRHADPVDQLVEVEGTFDQVNQGFGGNWSGAITHVFRIKKLDQAANERDQPVSGEGRR